MNYHDVLARMGVIHAHPGGKDVTDIWMNAISLPDRASVLDVGCGNGATACTIAKRWNCQVTAIDIRPRMVENTKKRAIREGVNLRSVQASAESIPIAESTFDLVVCESVLVFVRTEKALLECNRVLKPNGQLIDVEMMTLKPVTKAWREEVKQVYGAVHVPDLSGWKKTYTACRFVPRVIRSGPITSLTISENQHDVHTGGMNAFSDPRVLQMVEANGRWLEANQDLMGYGVFLLQKTPS